MDAQHKRCTWCDKEITGGQEKGTIVFGSKGIPHYFHDYCEDEFWNWFRDHRDESL
jgi:hypothetical protein